jgi:hypothetical protein
VARWQQILDESPEFAQTVQRVFDAHLHKTLATLRRDGAPRISAIEATFLDGELLLGMMPGSLKARDVLRDPRLALHSATVDETLAVGDAKISGRGLVFDNRETLLKLTHGSEELADGAHQFRVDIDEVVLTHVEGNDLVIESWHEGRGLERVSRR